jgi:Plant transposon protein
MFGSLDCMHTYRKNCPVAWQQSFHGKQESGPTMIVLEAIAGYNLWFWHVSYGYIYSGALNDLNILIQSQLLKKLINGSFCEVLERKSGVGPFTILMSHLIDCMYWLMASIQSMAGWYEVVSNQSPQKSTSLQSGKSLLGRRSKDHLEYSKESGKLWQHQFT